jgi:hypothetical protein
MLRIGVATAGLVIALSFTGSAQSDNLPLFNAHASGTAAEAGWRSDGSQVSIAVRDYATTNLNEGERPPHQEYTDLGMCIEQPGRTICSRSIILSANEFGIVGSLDTAVINAVVPAEECSGVPITCTTLDLRIHLTWKAIGSLDRSTRWHNKWQGTPHECHLNEMGSIVSRLAEIEGTISDGTREFIAGLDNVYAYMTKFRSAVTGQGDAICL